MRRRELLGGAAAAGALAGNRDAAAWVIGVGGTSPVVPTLSAELTFPGGSPVAGTLVYDMSVGNDMGNYAAPTAGFTQRCVRVRHASLANFWVDFRPDVSGGRVEVVCWNGECDPVGLTVASGYTRELPAYTLVVKQNGSTIHTESVQRHYWGQRWRWYSAARTVVRTAAQVFSDGFLPPMSSAAARVSGYSGVIVPPVPPAQASYTTFMMPNVITGTTTTAASAIAGATSLSLTSSAGIFIIKTQRLIITQSNGSTLCAIVSSDSTNPVVLDRPLEFSVTAGATIQASEYKLGIQLAIDGGANRPEIGALTEWQGDWLIRGTSSSLAAMLAHAEMWSSDLNWFMMWDKQTGRAINFKTDSTRYFSHSYTDAYGGFYWIKRGFYNGFEWHEAEAHSYSMLYLPWVLTEDPYYIETQQAMVAWYVGYAIYQREVYLQFLPVGTRRVCSYLSETRTLGWGIRNLATVWKMSPVSPPSWLNPRSMYSEYSDDYSYVTDYFFRTPGNGAEANVHAIFRQLGGGAYYQAFEQAYGLIGLGLATFWGLPVTTAPTWFTQLSFFFGMFDGLMNGTSGWNRQSPQPHDVQYTAPADSAYLPINSYTTWNQFYNGLITTYPSFKINNDPPPANQQGGSITNGSVMLAACAIAQSLGVAAAPVCKAWLDSYVDYNWPLIGAPFQTRDGFTGT